MKYHNITSDDMLNGEGLRVVLWVSGCEHGCKDCHNQITWNANEGLVFDDDAKQEIIECLDKNYIQGITFSGGDPLYKSNVKEITEFCKFLKNKYGSKKDIWLYTGYLFEDIEKLEILNYIDVLLDGKYDKNLSNTNLEWVGSSNQRVIDVKESLIQKKLVPKENNAL